MPKIIFNEIGLPCGKGEGGIDLTAEQWSQYKNNPGSLRWNGNGWDDYTPPAQSHEEKLEALRRERDCRLRACDFTQLPDAPLDQDKKSSWAAYRQALRDLPETIGDLNNIVWPVAPGGI